MTRSDVMSLQSDERKVAPIGRRAHSINEAAALIGIGRDGIYGLIRTGKLKARKCGKRTIILDDDLRECASALPRLELAP
jgi:excisionase family DNA binding protein